MEKVSEKANDLMGQNGIEKQIKGNNSKDNNDLNSFPNTVKIKCNVKKFDKEINLEVDNSLTVKGLKKIISEKGNLDRTFKLMYNEKDLSQCRKIKLIDLFSKSKDVDGIKLEIIFTRPKVSKSEKRLKYMLECNLHLNENAHFYCFTCKTSFCTLCFEEHHTHDFIDKYEYSKPNEEIVNGIMDEFIVSLRKLEEENKNNIFSHILHLISDIENENNININNKCKKRESNSNLLYLNNSKDPNVERSIEELKSVYQKLVNKNLFLLKDQSLKKIEDFKQNLLKFKMICHNSLNFSQNKKIADIIVLEEEYFLEIHNTLKDLKVGKNALIKYMNTLNKEYEEEKKSFEVFDLEIKSDIDKIIQKIKNKIENSKIEPLKKEKEESISINELDIKSEVKSELKSEYIKLPLGFIKNSIMQSQISESNFDSQTVDISTSVSEIYSKFIMKRRLGAEKKPPDIILYNSTKKQFEMRKINIPKEIKLKKFLQFSVFVNVDNILYISGGKRKNGKCISDFYSFHPDTNELVKHSNMLKERCSHSMIYFNNYIYAVGGYSNNTAERYNLQSNQIGNLNNASEKRWERLPDLNSKERQVPTLLIYNQQYLMCLFGYINNDLENEDFIERLDIKQENPTHWEIMKISHNLGKYDLKLFNVGLIPLNHSQFLICGGEHYHGEETDNVYLLDLKYLTVINPENLKLPIKCSFIDKNFVRYTAIKFGQYEMKKNNLILFNSYKCKFKLKSF